VRKAARKARVTKRVTVHTFRHACATHMLQNGADIRYIQKLLGHRSLLSTEVYTHLEIRDLKRIHRRCHPRAKSRKDG
jgi:integrase/recombinase XerD